MRFWIHFLALLGVCLTGCVSKKEEQFRARQAYFAGQQQAAAAAAAHSQTPQGPMVTVQGSVRNPMVPWTEGLTAAKAIVAADYTGFMNPVIVRVIRNGQVVAEFKGVDLLHGQDAPLEAGDIVVLE